MLKGGARCRRCLQDLSTGTENEGKGILETHGIIGIVGILGITGITEIVEIIEKREKVGVVERTERGNKKESPHQRHLGDMIEKKEIIEIGLHLPLVVEEGPLHKTLT